MTRPRLLPVASALLLLTLTLASCSRDTSNLRPYPPNTEPLVFGDTFGPDVDFQAFQGSKLDAATIDATEFYSGTASLKIVVPAPGDPSGGYAGGALTTSRARQLIAYNAISFWAKSSVPISFDVAGLGNDNTGTSRYEASVAALPMTSTWTRYVVPIPLPARLTAEKGLFFFAEGPENGAGCTVWLDEIQFEQVAEITDPRPSMPTRSVGAFVGATVSVTGAQTTFTVEGSDRIVSHMSGYFDFISSDPTVVKVENSTLTVVGNGSAAVTAQLGGTPATGTVTVNASTPPAVAAPTPTLPAADVISLFSDAYDDVPVDTWSTGWDRADLTDLLIAGNPTKAYTNLLYAGVEFTAPTIDASAMTHLHVDVWMPQGNVFRIKLVDFGANGIFGGGDDREHEVFFNVATDPPIVIGSWMSLDIPLSSFAGLTTRGHLAQMIFSGDPGTIFIDNVYFHR